MSKKTYLGPNDVSRHLGPTLWPCLSSSYQKTIDKLTEEPGTLKSERIMKDVILMVCKAQFVGDVGTKVMRKSYGDELMGIGSELEKNGRLAFAARVSVVL